MNDEFQIIEKLGQGGMGVVYKALEKRLNRVVAMKVMAEHLAENPTFVARFEREARAAALLTHPHVVTLHTVGRYNKLPMMVMEYVPGMSLSDLTRSEGAVEPKRALKWIEQVAGALAVAHDANIIHRDIKPHNILLHSESDNVKVTDFGIAQLVEDQIEATATGVQLGTPRYMSPEQCEGKRVTLHTDIYSLGTVLYELLAGKPAIVGNHPVEIIRKIVDLPTPNILTECPTLPHGFAQITAKMMAKRAEARYSTARAIVEDIRSLLSTGVAPGAMDVELAASALPPLPGAVQDSRPLPGTARDFVVHYVESDAAWAEWIHMQLTEAGYVGDLDIWNFKTSHESLRKLLKGVSQKECVISIVSPPYLTAIHGHSEWAQAFMHGDLQPIPVRVRACNLSGTFRTLNYIDTAELDQQSSKAALLNEIRERCGPREPVKRVVDFKQMYDGLGNIQLRHTVWNLPQSGREEFVGRSSSLAEIHMSLQSKRGAVLLQWQPNDVGCGATELALEYARLNRSTYEVVWILQANERLGSMIDYVRLASELELKEKDATSLPVAIKAVRSWLDQNDKWLVICDDVTSKGDLAGYLPSQPKGHILITTSDPEWAQSYAPITVGPFERDMSVDFLMRRSGQRNEGACAALASAMGDVALPMTLAASYVRSERTSLDKYIDMFLTRHRDLWGFQNPPKHVRAVTASALSLLTDLLALKSPQALDLLKVCAYWGSSNNRLARISSSAKLFPRTLAKALQNSKELKDAVSLLVQLGLVREKDDVLSFPTLVQELIRSWIETDPESAPNDAMYRVLDTLNGGRNAAKHRMTWPLAAFEFALAQFPNNPAVKEAWDECDLVMPQFVSVLGHVQRLGLEKEKVEGGWQRLGKYLAERSVYNFAAESYERAIALHKEKHGDKHKGLPDLFKELAKIRWKQSHLDEARVAFEEALIIEERVHGKAHPSIATSLSNLGNVCVQLADHPRARHYYLRALEMALQIYGKFHEEVGRHYSNLGLVSQELGDLNAAWEYYRNALSVFERVAGGERQMATAAKNLAGLLYTMGDLAEAKKYYIMAIEYDKANHGEHHASIAQDYHNLAMTVEGLGFDREALHYYQKALATNEAVYGRNHPKVGMNYNNLGNLAARGGDLKGAESYCKDAYRIFRQAYGENHKMTETALRNWQRVRSRIAQEESGPKVS